MSTQQDKIDAKVGNDHAHDAFDPSEYPRSGAGGRSAGW